MTQPMTTPRTASDDDGVKEKAAASAGVAQEQATALVGASKDQAAQVAGTAKDQAASVATAATDQARDLLSEAQEELTTQASTQKDKAASGLRALSEGLSAMAQNSENGGIATHLVGEAGRRSGSFADYLDEREPGQLLNDLRDLGRRRTGGFLLGAAILGFAGGRLLKGSRSDAGTPAASDPDIDANTTDLGTPDIGLPQFDDEPTTLTGRYGSLAATPSLMSPDDV